MQLHGNFFDNQVSNSIIYSQSDIYYNTNYDFVRVLTYDVASPNNYQTAYYTETLTSQNLRGGIIIDELYVTTLHYTNLKTSSNLFTATPTISTYNPIFQNIYLDASNNPNQLIDIGYNDPRRQTNA